MIAAEIAAVVSMVATVVTTIAAVSHKEMDVRYRRLIISAAILGLALTVLDFCLYPEIIRPTLTWVMYLGAVVCVGIIAITAKGTGMATRVISAVPWRRRQRD